MLTFKIFAGSMFCGILAIDEYGFHRFRNRDNKLSDCFKINDYKNLNMKRV